MLHDLVAALLLDEPARDQSAHRMGHNVEDLAVLRSQPCLRQPTLEEARILLNCGLQVLIIKREDQVIAIGQRRNRRICHQLVASAGSHPASVSDNAMNVEQYPPGDSHTRLNPVAVVIIANAAMTVGLDN